MIKKFETVLDLLKVGGLAAHYAKAASFHKAKSSAHEAISKAHSDYAAAMKAKHDGMDDGDVNKGFMKAHADFHATKAAHHETLHALHKAHADHLHELAQNVGEDEQPAPAGAKCQHEVEMTKACDKCNRKAAELATTVSLDNLFTGALKGEFEEYKKTDEFRNMIREVMKREASKALGLELEPTRVNGVIPSNPNIKLVGRPGGFPVEQAEDKDVDPVAADVIGS